MWYLGSGWHSFDIVAGRAWLAKGGRDGGSYSLVLGGFNRAGSDVVHAQRSGWDEAQVVETAPSADQAGDTGRKMLFGPGP